MKPSVENLEFIIEMEEESVSMADEYVKSIFFIDQNMQVENPNQLVYFSEKQYPRKSWFDYEVGETPIWEEEQFSNYFITLRLSLKFGMSKERLLRATEETPLFGGLVFKAEKHLIPSTSMYSVSSIILSGNKVEDHRIIEKYIKNMIYSREFAVFSSSMRHKTGCGKQIKIYLETGILNCESCSYSTSICSTPCMTSRYQENGLDLCDYCLDELNFR